MRLLQCSRRSGHGLYNLVLKILAKRFVIFVCSVDGRVVAAMMRRLVLVVMMMLVSTANDTKNVSVRLLGIYVEMFMHSSGRNCHAMKLPTDCCCQPTRSRVCRFALLTMQANDFNLVCGCVGPLLPMTVRPPSRRENEPRST